MSAFTGQTYSNSSTGMSPRLPYHQRHAPIAFTSDDGNTGETAYAVNYTELYNLKGRLLTLVDATFTDPEQRKAHKDMVWQTLRSWMSDIEDYYRQAGPAATEAKGAEQNIEAQVR